MKSKWSKQFITGIQEIDEQHFTIIKKLFEIEKLSKIPHSKSEILDALLFLETYTRMHFRTEEKLMEERACPALQENLQQHQVFMQYIHTLNENFARGELDAQVLEQVQKELSDWVVNHISQVDMQLKQPLAGESES